MSLFDGSTLVWGSATDREEKAEAEEASPESGEKLHGSSAKEATPDTGEEEETERTEKVSGPSVKVPVILKPEHVEWAEDQDFGLSEWVRNAISEEIGEKKDIEPGKEDETSEDASPAPEMCDVCGKNPSVTEVTNGDDGVTKVCRECLQKRTGESPEKQEKGKDESFESPSHLCERCEQEFGVEHEAVRKVSLGSGEKRWLCENCMQEIGARQARRH